MASRSWLLRGAAVTFGTAVGIGTLALACGGSGGDDAPPDFTGGGRRDGGRDGSLGIPVDGGGGGDDAAAACNGTCITRVALGGSFGCAVGDDSVVRCWGDNGLGQAGVAGAANVLVPRRVAGLSGVKDLSAANEHACAVTDDGRVLCWGRNGDGVVTGAVDSAPHPTPTEIRGLPKAATRVFAWSDHACALLQGGDLYCWGANDYGQCGVGAADGGVTPVTVPKPARATGNVSQVGGSEEATCVVTSGASMSCFGRNFSGQLAQGTSDTNEHPSPLAAQGVAGTIAQIAPGSGYHLALALADGRVQLWGSNAHGSTAPDDTAAFEVTKPRVYAGVSNVKEIVAGGYFTCARKGDGAVVCWGDNEQGQSGAAGGGDKRTPVEVAAARGATQIAAGREGFACALVCGRVTCWGDNAAGQLGRGKLGGTQFPPGEITFGE